MHRLMIPFALAAAAAATSAPALAQERPSRECGDDNGVDRCAAEQQQRVRELFGVPPIEELQAAGAEVRRAFFVDGYGRDQIALTFIRARGRDPMVSVHFKREKEGRVPPPIEALVPAETWETVLQRGQNFDRKLVPLPEAPANGAITICLHSWVSTVESVEAPKNAAGELTIRRITQNACGDSLAVDYSFELAALALPLFPFCEALDPRSQRNNVTRLTACGLLEGDRLAAANAFNKALELANINGADDAGAARYVFDYSAKLDWAGTQLGGRGGQAFQAWVERTTGTPTAHLFIHRAVAERSDRVRVEGSLHRYEAVPGDADMPDIELRAPVTLLFESQPNDPEMQVERASVGAFVRTKQAQD